MARLGATAPHANRHWLAGGQKSFGQHPPLNATGRAAPAQRLTNRKIRASFLRMQNGGKPGNFERINELGCSKPGPKDQNLCSAI
jgi:hypothetical protein